MAAETTTYTPVKLFAGHFPEILTAPATLLTDENLAAYTLLAADSAGKLYAHPGNETGFVAATSAGSPTVEIDTTIPVAGILVEAANASTGTTNNNGETVVAGTSADLAVNIYKSGNFFASQLVFKLTGGGDMADVATDILKQKLVNDSLIALAFQDTGEV